MKGILLAGGSGTRLYPSTIAISKQMIPIYDKPMIYYPLSVLMLAGIREIMIISTPRDIISFKELFKDGSKLGLDITYAVQEEPKGIAEAFIIAEKFIGDEQVALILGDNVFYGYGLSTRLENAILNLNGATIFGYHVTNPKEFGVVEFDVNGKVISIEEKPVHPKSNYAIPGLYFYDSNVTQYAKQLTPSKRGEIEITDINNRYLEQNQLQVELFGRGMAWLDTGTHRGLLEASNFVDAIQSRQGLYVACLEEIAFRKGFINRTQLIELGNELNKTEYGQYILHVANTIE